MSRHMSRINGIMKRSFILGLATALSISLSSCSGAEAFNGTNHSSAQDAERFDDVSDEPLRLDGSGYDSRLPIDENMQRLNAVLEERSGEGFALASVAEYESSTATGWTVVIEGDKVGIDLSTWKNDCAPNSSEKAYMNGILSAFTFFYGQQMGEALWRLTGDLVDNGADESLYGFHHVGGKAIYETGASATYGATETSADHTTMYVWITPEGTSG